MIRQSHIVPDAYQKTAWVLYRHILFSVKKTFLGHLKLVLIHLLYWRRKIWVDLHCWWLAARHNAQSFFLFSPFVRSWFFLNVFCCAIWQFKGFVARVCYFSNDRALFVFVKMCKLQLSITIYFIPLPVVLANIIYIVLVACVLLSGQDLQICEIGQWFNVFRLKELGLNCCWWFWTVFMICIFSRD